jgi:hypothetical protein
MLPIESPSGNTITFDGFEVSPGQSSVAIYIYTNATDLMFGEAKLSGGGISADGNPEHQKGRST